MVVLGFKGTHPSDVLRRIKGLLAQGRKATRRKPDLVNPLEDGSHLLPLLVRHPGQATLSRDPGVDDHGPIREPCPQCTAARGNGGTTESIPRILRLPRTRPRCFIDRWSHNFRPLACSCLTSKR